MGKMRKKNTAPQMSVSPVVPPDVAQPIYATAVLPATGTYKIYVRLRNRVGNLSPISNVYDARFEIPASATGSRSSQPQWAGDFNNTIHWTHDGEHRIFTDRDTLPNAISFADWDGASDFPFGQHTGFGIKNTATGDKTTYTTEPYEFETAARREVYVAIELLSPIGKAATDPDGFEITLLSSTSPLDTDGDIVSPTSTVVNNGANINLTNVRSIQAVINFYNQRNHALTSVIVGWREVV